MNRNVKSKFDSYPGEIRSLMYELRRLIYEVASEEGVGDLEECLKWGEPSYLSKRGSTIRIDWKKRSPDEYAIYFNCKTKLVETFRELYPEVFRYSDNRAIILRIGEKIPVSELKHCISLALKYHTLKGKPLLGA